MGISQIDHPIIQKPFEFDIIGFNLDCSSFDESEHSLTITFRKNEIIKKLKFIEPKEISIEKGFPTPTRGLVIWDISNQQLEDINIQVADIEASHGALNFYAKDVIEIN